MSDSKKPNKNESLVYSAGTVAVQNKLQECFKAMSVDEKRLLILASPLARINDSTEQDSILITAQEFADECGIKVNSAYKQLEKASKNLVDRSFSYINDRQKKVYSNWVIDATYEEAGVSLRFTGIVLAMLKVLDRFNPYTKYDKSTVLKLKKDYAIDFYHLAKKYQKIGQFTLTIDDMFNEFGLPDSYRDLSNLKKRVLKTPIDEINLHTDINLEYTPIKNGRTVIGYTFKIKTRTLVKDAQVNEKSKSEPVRIKLTNSQISTFAAKLSSDPAFGSNHANEGEDMTAFRNRLEKELTNSEKVQQYMPYLVSVGFILAPSK